MWEKQLWSTVMLRKRLQHTLGLGKVSCPPPPLLSVQVIHGYIFGCQIFFQGQSGLNNKGKQLDCFPPDLHCNQRLSSILLLEFLCFGQIFHILDWRCSLYFFVSFFIYLFIISYVISQSCVVLTCDCSSVSKRK